MTGNVGGEERLTVGVVWLLSLAVVTGQAPGPPQRVHLYHCEFHIFGAFQTVVKQIHFILTRQYTWEEGEWGAKCFCDW